MIVVVADTSPLNYLIQINCDHVLPALYERVLVPTAVVEELDHPRSVAAVRAWLTRLPSWLVVEQVAETADVRLARLDLQNTDFRYSRQVIAEVRRRAKEST